MIVGINNFCIAQNWPTKPIRLVIGLPSGGGSDPLARALSQRLSTIWGQPVVVDNRPGANTSLATDMVAKSKPDGYTLLFGIDMAFTLNPYLYAKLPYDPINDFTPITQINTFSLVLVANPNLPANNVSELISLAKSQPGKITYASTGAGSQMHLLTCMLENKSKVSMVHIPYKGIPQMMMATAAGEVDLSWVGPSSAKPLLLAGKLKAIGFGASKRSPFLPEVPTFAEAGYPSVEMSVWFGILGPAGIPRNLVDRINKDILSVINDPEFRKNEITNRAYETTGLGPDEFSALIKRELISRSELVRISGAKLD
jgi:tripartite-type tricarboxylate transporter receptor subunit TctC